MSALAPISIFTPPYDALEPFTGDDSALIRNLSGQPGVVLVWSLHAGMIGRMGMIRHRPGGVSLMVMLPSAEEVSGDREILRIVETCRPHSILPYHPDLALDDLRHLARRPPDDLPAEVTDYLTWRGFYLDQEIRHLIRRMMEMSGEVRTVAALARGLYQSRRALGRKLLTAGLPVASHWLHLGRVLRAAIRLQSTPDSLFTVACDLGYPDGFALSNQMKRLTGLRPTATRDHLGWEWILERWLREEAAQGNLSQVFVALLLNSKAHGAGQTSATPPIPTQMSLKKSACPSDLAHGGSRG